MKDTGHNVDDSGHYRFVFAPFTFYKNVMNLIRYVISWSYRDASGFTKLYGIMEVPIPICILY